MENPTTWNPVVKKINDLIVEFHKRIEAGVCGLSLALTIYNEIVQPLEKTESCESQSVTD